MVGLIWMVQVVHYPLFAEVGEGRFVDYEKGHTTRISRLLVIPAVLEIVLAAAIAVARPQELAPVLAFGAGVLLALIWVMTAIVQARQHGKLSRGFEPAVHRRLVSGNWWRTGAWTVRGILSAVMLV